MIIEKMMMVMTKMDNLKKNVVVIVVRTLMLSLSVFGNINIFLLLRVARWPRYASCSDKKKIGPKERLIRGIMMMAWRG
jgi:hypothetical protein